MDLGPKDSFFLSLIASGVAHFFRCEFFLFLFFKYLRTLVRRVRHGEWLREFSVWSHQEHLAERPALLPSGTDAVHLESSVGIVLARIIDISFRENYV